MAHNRGFDRQKYDIGDIRGIYKKVRHSWVGSRTLMPVGARLGSQTLAVVEERMKFQILSNKAVRVGNTKTYRSYRCQVRV